MNNSDLFKKIQGRSDMLRHAQRGYEKESLRVDLSTGVLASTDHPSALGAALTHPHITQDFGEAQIEWVTGTHNSIENALAELEEWQAFTQHGLLDFDETIWPLSVPCPIESEADFRHAYIGNKSDLGRIRELYRRGLRERYGAIMQSVSGFHYNFSFPESLWDVLEVSQDEGYLAATRNMRRRLWSLIYLYGASPAVHSSFAEGREHNLQQLPCGLGMPWATSLRISNLGYNSEAQADLGLAFNSLNDYIAELEYGLHQPWEAFQAIDKDTPEGEKRQINANIFQLENEFYSQIRLKPHPRENERAVSTLKQHGIGYLEVRTLDLNPFTASGISCGQACFIETLLWASVLLPSPKLQEKEVELLRLEFNEISTLGRAPDWVLPSTGKPVSQSGAALCDELQPVVQLLDEAYSTTKYSQALDEARNTFANPQLCLSAQVLEQAGDDLMAWTLNQARIFKEQRTADVLDHDRRLQMVATVDASHQQLRDLEQQPTDTSFDDVLNRYLNG